MITLHYLKPTHSHALLVLWVLSLISFYVEPSHKQEQSSTLKIHHSRQYVICSQALEYVYIQKNTFIIRAVSRVFLGKPLFQKRLSFFPCSHYDTTWGDLVFEFSDFLKMHCEESNS